jgi:hypothetical protein
MPREIDTQDETLATFYKAVKKCTPEGMQTLAIAVLLNPTEIRWATDLDTDEMRELLLTCLVQHGEDAKSEVE